MFSITFNDVVRPSVGEIQIGSFTESFESDLSMWTPVEYSDQWRTALKALLSGAETEALITSIPNIENANFFTWWPIYRGGDGIVKLQNYLFFINTSNAFSLDDYQNFIPEFERCDDEGVPNSVWETTEDEIRRFLSSSNL